MEGAFAGKPGTYRLDGGPDGGLEAPAIPRQFPGLQGMYWKAFAALRALGFQASRSCRIRPAIFAYP